MNLNTEHCINISLKYGDQGQLKIQYLRKLSIEMKTNRSYNTIIVIINFMHNILVPLGYDIYVEYIAIYLPVNNKRSKTSLKIFNENF